MLFVYKINFTYSFWTNAQYKMKIDFKMEKGIYLIMLGINRFFYLSIAIQRTLIHFVIK